VLLEHRAAGRGGLRPRTVGRGFRRAARGLLGTAARMAAGVLAAIAVCAVGWAGPVAYASSSALQSSPSASPSPLSVKYYIVQRLGNGSVEPLYDIAAKTLGNGSRYPEIFALNKGRLQPGGGRLTNPRAIQAGWILQLPADATGPKVHLGPLPAVRAPAPAPVSQGPSAPVAAASAGHSFGAADVLGVGVLIVVAGLAVMLGPRIRRRVRHRGAHGKAPRSRPSGRTASAGPAQAVTRSGAPARPDTSSPDSRQADDPSWPGGNYLSSPEAGYPSFPRESYYGSLGPEHPSWPGADPRSWPRAIGRSAEGSPEPARALHQDPRPRPVSPPAAGPGFMPGSQAVLTPGFPAGRERATGPGGQHAAGQQPTGPGGQYAADPYAAGQQSAAQHTTGQHATGRPLAAQVSGLADPVRQQVTDLWNTDSIRLAERMLAEAEDQATKIVTTAEREAAELRAAVAKLTTELGTAAPQVIENLAIPALPGTSAKPPTRPASRPATKPQTSPAARPATRPGVSPRRAPKARPAANPKARQIGAWRKMAAALAVLFLVGVTSAATEIGLHGLSFFVFRNTGAGAGNSQNLNEDQGPGQPGAHHKANVNRPSGKASGKASTSK
jgi:hypothetical protein